MMKKAKVQAFPNYKELQEELQWWKKNEPHIVPGLKLNASYETLHSAWKKAEEYRSNCIPYFIKRYGIRGSY